MANTTNFGWETPDDTDLVKDGAAAIRTLGSAIDTSLVDLKGGTTGQVLSKATGTDMDFTWTTSSVARGLNEIIPTSVAVGSGTATVGTNGMITCTAVGTSLSVNGCFSSTYTNYMVVLDAIYSASYTFYDLRLRASGADNSTANSYVWQSVRVSNTTVSGARLTANRFQEPLALSSDVSAANITFYKPFTTDKTGISIADHQFALSGAYNWNGNGSHNQTTSYDGFTLIDTNQSGGGQTFTGKIRIYGWQE